MPQDTYIIYTHHKLDTHEVFYVGQGKYKKRAYAKDSRSSWWKSVVNKHGYFVVIRAVCLSKQQANAIEESMIICYGRKDQKLGTLVNMTDGGEGRTGVITTQETLLRMRDAQLGKKKPRSKNSGSCLTATAIKNSADARRGKPLTPEHRAKLSMSHKARHKQ